MSKKQNRRHLRGKAAGVPPTRDPVPSTVESNLLPPYPIGDDGSDAADFIQRAAGLLGDPHTAIYTDTSFVMWLTKGGVDSRQQFIDWAAALDRRIHVPVWTYHEYYRHHSRDTLRNDLAAEAKKLRDAAKRYADMAQTYADDPLKPGFSADGFQRELEALQGRIKEITETAERWDYDVAARQLTKWMAERLCRSQVVFDLMDRIGHVGDSRYTQDVPPGYMDRIKADMPDKGSNKYGDLILWHEVLAHVSSTAAKSVVMLTRDRKPDWFARSKEPALQEDLKRMSRRQRWDPVPSPHPTLLIELRERTQAKELVLLDSLYFGAALHSVGTPSRSRLIAYALGVPPSAYIEHVEKSTTPAAHAAPLRHQSTPLSLTKARGVCRVASMPVDAAALSPGASAISARLQGDLPQIEAFIDALDHDVLGALSLDDAAMFARWAADEALKPEGYATRLVVAKLLELLPTTRADVAAATYAGLLASAYFDGTIARAVPTSSQLQAIFDQLGDQAFSPVLKCIALDLGAARCKALFIPDAATSRIVLRFAHDATQDQTPVVLQQISLGDRNLLTEVGRILPENLVGVLGGRRVATIDDLLEVTAQHYGLPTCLLEVTGADLSDSRTIPETLGFIVADDAERVEDTSDVPSDEALNAMPAHELVPEDEDAAEAKAFLDDDHDD